MQVAIPVKNKVPIIPKIGYVIPDGKYQGPRITKAPLAVANHVKAYYSFCGVLICLLFMGIIGGVATGLGVKFNSSCVTISGNSYDTVSFWLIVFGPTDLGVFLILLIIVVTRAFCCADRHNIAAWSALILFTLFCLAFFLLGVFLLLLPSNGQNIFSPQNITLYSNTVMYCNKDLRNFTFFTWIFVTIGLFTPFIYIFILCRARCRRKRKNTTFPAH